jgi:colicin import membrane protein
MIRQREKEVVWQAGAFTVLVHGLLLALLLMSFQWKTVKPMSIAEVELWDSIPTPQTQAQVTPPDPEPPAPTPEPPKVVEPVKPEPKPEPAPEPKADIQVKKAIPKPEKVEKQKPEKVKQEKPKSEPKPEKQDPEALKKLQQALLAEDAKVEKQEVAKPAASPSGDKTAQKAQAGVTNPTEMAKYVGLISSKIRQHVNRQLCGTDKATKLTFVIALMPTGEVMGHPKLLKGSGLSACDDAVERAILESQPLPVPSSADLFSQFRDLKLEFSPNAEN